MNRGDAKTRLRWLIGLAVLVVLAIVFRNSLGFLGEAVRTLRTAAPLPVVFAVVAAAVSMIAMAQVMNLLMRAANVPTTLRDCNDLTLAANSWSTTMPGGPAFAAVLALQVQRQWGATVAVGAWYFMLSGALSTLWMVLMGLLAVVFMGADLSVWSLLGSLAGVAITVWALYWATTHPQTLRRWAHAMKLPEKVGEQLGSLSQVSMDPRTYLAAAGYSLANKLLDVVMLWCAVWSVTGALPALHAGTNETTVMGVTLAFLSAKIAGSAQVTPAGVGVVEGATVGALVATGMTVTHATAATIIYRLVSFVLVAAYGWVIYFARFARDGFSSR